MLTEAHFHVKPMARIDFETPIKSIEVPESLVRPRIVKPYHSGEFVAVRPIKKNKEQEQTYFGIMLGDMNIALGHSVKGEAAVLSGCLGNPAIFIPKLAQLVYGAECFWKLITSEEQLTTIADEDLDRWRALLHEQICKWQETAAQYRAEN